jgi:hypothetical protein
MINRYFTRRDSFDYEIVVAGDGIAIVVSAAQQAS